MNFDLENTRRDLIAMREKYGAKTDIGHRCSNLVEMLQNYEGATGDQRTTGARMPRDPQYHQEDAT